MLAKLVLQFSALHFYFSKKGEKSQRQEKWLSSRQLLPVPELGFPSCYVL
jgi:hypothetical protein